MDDNSVSKVMAEMARRRWAGKSPEERKAEMAKVQAKKKKSKKALKAVGQRLAEARKAARERRGQ